MERILELVECVATKILQFILTIGINADGGSSSFHLHLLIIEKTHDAPKHARREPFTNKISQKRTAPLHTRARTHAHTYILLFDADKCVAQPKFFVARRVS